MKAYPSQGYTFFLCLFLSLLLSACQLETSTPDKAQPLPPNSSGSSSPTPFGTPASAKSTVISTPTLTPVVTTATATPRPEGGVALVGVVGSLTSLNPILNTSLTLQELRPLLFETLLRVDPVSAALQPGLAQSWVFSDDGKQVTFQLPANLKWGDGTVLTAVDIVASLEATDHPALQAFSRIRASNDTSLTLTMPTINCSAVTSVAQLPLLPSQEITTTIPLGSGPFVIGQWSENKRTLELNRNPHYHRTPSALGGIRIRFLPEEDIKVALSEGQFDLIGPLQPAILPAEIPERLTDVVYPDNQMIYLAINFAPKNEDPLDPNIRAALLQALDREAILAEALQGDGQLLSGPLPAEHWAYSRTLSPPVYDPALARKLLAEADLRDRDGDGWLEQAGQRLELSIRLNGQNEIHQNLGWLISSYYRELGLFARAEGVSLDSIVDDLFTHDFVLAIYRWPLLSDPDQTLYWHSGENVEGLGLNFTSYSNPALDRLLQQANRVPGCDPATRAEFYAEIQDLLNQERPVDFLVAPNNHLLQAVRLQGLQPGPFAPFTWNAAEWYLQEE